MHILYLFWTPWIPLIHLYGRIRPWRPGSNALAYIDASVAHLCLQFGLLFQCWCGVACDATAPDAPAPLGRPTLGRDSSPLRVWPPPVSSRRPASSRELGSTEYTSPARLGPALWADRVGVAKEELRDLRRALAEAILEALTPTTGEHLMPASQRCDGPLAWAASMACLGRETHSCTAAGSPILSSSPWLALVIQGLFRRSPNDCCDQPPSPCWPRQSVMANHLRRPDIPSAPSCWGTRPSNQWRSHLPLTEAILERLRG